MLNESMEKELNTLLHMESQGVKLSSEESKRLEYLLEVAEEDMVREENKKFTSQLCNYL